MLRRWIVRLKPSYLPVAIGASVLLVSWFYLLWNTTAGELYPAVRFRSKTTIAGIVQDATQTFSLHAVLTGTYQTSVSSAIGELSPVFKPAIMWKNQLYFALFGAAGSESVVVGQNQQLFEKTYLDEYCSRNLATLRSEGEQWAARIRSAQDFFEARDKLFLYIITPSKAAQLPQFIPANYTCPAPVDDRARKLVAYGEILAHHGVQFVDAASDLAAARDADGIEMFPRGGTHWNALAAALGTQKVIAAVNARRHGPPLTTFSFTWNVSYNPQGIDRDLVDIMNLPHPDLHYPVPVLAFQSDTRPGNCPTARIAEVGGSFLGGINSTMDRLDCPPDITLWSYWDRRGVRYSNKRWHMLPMDPEQRIQSLLDADVIVLEENEALAPNSQHGRLMLQAIETISAGNPHASK